MDFRVMVIEKIVPFLRQHARELAMLLFALLLIHDIFGQHGLLAMRRSQQEARQVRRELQRLDEENKDLRDCVNALKSDPRAIEKIAREERGLAKPGEYIFKLPPSNPNSTCTAVQNPPKR